MPRGNGTGPMGMGPMTGRGAGYCAGFNTPGYANPAPRMGMGFRRGAGFYGRGFGRGVARGTGRGFGRGFGRGVARGTGRGFGRGFARRPINYAPVAYQQPVYPNYGYFNPNQNPTYQTRPAYGTW